MITFYYSCNYSSDWTAVIYDWEKLLNLSHTAEIFKSHIAHWWSPDGARLAYATINDTLVPKMEIPMFTGSVYPTARLYHYPKVKIQLGRKHEDIVLKMIICYAWMFFFQAGEENPIISLYVVNLNGPLHTVEMRRPEDQRIGWADCTSVIYLIVYLFILSGILI